MTFPHNSVRKAVEYINRIYRITDEMTSFIRYLDGDKSALKALSGDFTYWLYLESEKCVRIAFEDVSAWYRSQEEQDYKVQNTYRQAEEDYDSGYGKSFLLRHKKVTCDILEAMKSKGYLTMEISGLRFSGSKRMLGTIFRLLIRYRCVRLHDADGNPYTMEELRVQLNCLFGTDIIDEFNRIWPGMEKKVRIKLPIFDIIDKHPYDY